MIETLIFNRRLKRSENIVTLNVGQVVKARVVKNGGDYDKQNK